MKKLILATFVAAAFCGSAAVANTPTQDKPVTKTTTTVKKTSPVKVTTSTKSVHKKHVKTS